MLKQLSIGLNEGWQAAAPYLRSAWALARAAGSRLWAVVRPPLVLALQVLAALVLLFEEWGWQPLMALLGRLSRFRPWAVLELWIAGLPPYAALVAFALPTTILLPLKLVSVWLLADGYFITAGAVFLGAKVVSTALIARIFTLTKPALMQIGWFARAYGVFVPWKDHFFGMIRASWPWRYGRMVKNRIRLEAKRAWARWRPAIEDMARSARVEIRRMWSLFRPALRMARSRIAADMDDLRRRTANWWHGLASRW